MVLKTNSFRPVPCVCCSLDTGRLNAETYQLFDAVEKHYGIHIEYTFPDAQETMELVRAKGMYSFYEDGHQECCRIRKVGGSAATWRWPASALMIASNPILSCLARLCSRQGLPELQVLVIYICMGGDA